MLAPHLRSLLDGVEEMLRQMPAGEERDRAWAALEELEWWLGALSSLSLVPGG
jgi:hypothetical protein